MSPPAPSDVPQDYPDLESHLLALVEKRAGLPTVEWMDFETDLFVEEAVKQGIVAECFEAFCPELTPGEGDFALAMRTETVAELITYFESISEELPSRREGDNFRFNF